MDESEYVCPLCCEELDISDREFYPCKCGYQVCMWCWHRIRESESGLCPACRTPYGEDPHQFSAVDVEEVLKANKEKEAAAKRERERQRHQHLAAGFGGVSTDSSVTNTSDGEAPVRNGALIDIPKDRTQLANMRVIRRNLVYAVGLPPNIAGEETLRKPEYFGQYGKISKIVLNRTQAAGSDPRRTSASAYVTFLHKEDTLACILALDGFYLENRNIRASYGTSKYCSAFIKSVRCNNPDCTYLHEMGAPEDTFTKQEIQAGYVTSGRDVLARQQQIVAEQLRQGSAGGVPRKRTGCGGPSGTGKSSTNPVFPAPEYDEPSKCIVPPPNRVARPLPGNSTMSGLSVTPATKIPRSSSVSSRSPPLGPLQGPFVGGLPLAGTHSKRASVGATAASVVAGVHNVSSKVDTPDPHTMLTPLTPLKRSTKSGTRASTNIGPHVAPITDDVSGPEKLAPLRNGNVKKQNGVRTSHGMIGTPSITGSPSVLGPSLSQENTGASSIGGDVIGPPLKPRTNMMSNLGDELAVSGVDSLGGRPIGMDSPEASSSVAQLSRRSSALGGEVFTGQLPNSCKTAIGSGKDKWNSSAVGGTPLGSACVLGTNPAGGPGLWGSSRDNPSRAAAGKLLPPGPVGGGRGGIIGSHIAAAQPSPANSSSALASILGINLPTGSGSLQESTNLWTSPTAPEQSPLASLNVSSIPSQDVIGGSSMSTASTISVGGSSLIGGVPIANAPNSSLSAPPVAVGGSSKSDIALLQSLLPGVHITSGNESVSFGGINVGGWGTPTQTSQQGLGPSSLEGDSIGGTWGGGSMPAGGPSIGAIGQSVPPQNQRRGPGIW